MAEQLGSTTVRIDGDIDPLKNAVQGAKQEVDSLGTETEIAQNRIEGATTKSAGSFRRLQSAIAAVTGPVGALTAAFALTIGKLVQFENRVNSSSERITEQNKKVVELERAYWRFARAQLGVVSAAEELDNKFDDVRNRMKEMMDQVSGDQRRRLEILVGELDTTRERAQEQMAERMRADRQKQLADLDFEIRERQRQIAESLNRGIADVVEATLPEEDQIRARYARVFEDLIAQLRTGLLPQEQFDEYTKRIREAVDTAEQYALQEARNRVAEIERLEIERGEKVAKANADAMIREMERAANTIRGEFGPAFLGGEQLVNAINRVATEINRRRNF